MDCSLDLEQHQHQQQHQHQKQQQPQHIQNNNSAVHFLDESIRNLKELSAVGSIGSPLKSNAVEHSQQQQQQVVKLRKFSDRPLSTTTTTNDSKSHTYRISMANLEETQESELDVILGELSLLEAQITCGDASFLPQAQTQQLGQSQSQSQSILTNGVNGIAVVGSPVSSAPATRTHSRTNSTISGVTIVSESSSATHSSSSGISENGLSSSSNSNSNMQTMLNVGGGAATREPRTESPDNDSAFSDTVSLLSSESSASSGASSALQHKQQQQQQLLKLQCVQHQLSGLPINSSSKAAKIQLALHKLEASSIRRLFVKAFTADGASKSLLVDERMTCGHVTRLLADKNHVQMQPNWALVENLGDLQMERLFEDHELLVDNLMTWNSDAGNRVLFLQRSDKISLFAKPEIYLPGPQMAPGSQHDEHTRGMLLEEFFETNSQLQVDGPLYMKADSKKAWKRYHFVLRSSGLYYFPKEKTKNTRDLACLTLFNGYNVYRGLAWKKKWKAPTDYTFGFKSAVDSSLGKSCRTLKMLCAEDLETMEKWITAIRISKYGKQLWENHKTLMEDLLCSGNSSDGMSLHGSFAVSMRSESISSISSAVPSQCGSVSSAISSMSNSSSGRVSRASSSSSSGCLSDDNNGFDSEFTTGTIKRKPSMKPNLPLTSMTRQLKEVGEITICEDARTIADCGVAVAAASPERSGTGTLTRRHSRRKSQESNGSGTLKRRQPMSAAAKRGSVESMNATTTAGTAGNSSGSSNSTPTPTPSISAKPLQEYALANESMSCMSNSTLSLDLPPPPPELLNEPVIYGSQLSLASLPPPPPPEEVAMAFGVQQQQQQQSKLNGSLPPAVPAKPIKTAVKAAPPYKAPPEYVAQLKSAGINSNAITTNSTVKKVSFADSPVLLRRKMCSPEPATLSPVLTQHNNMWIAPGTLTPRGSLANNVQQSHAAMAPDFGSPRRLQESASNPPRDFLKDLQRVMRKKWQVAQKCKLEPATTPHEVLGFRDFNDELLAHNLNNAVTGANTHYYRETVNVSNWVQEHYGAGAPAPPVPLPNEYALYENLHGNNNGDMLMEPQFPTVLPVPMSMAASRKKRPPPPPPKRSDSTQLTHRV